MQCNVAPHHSPSGHYSLFLIIPSSSSVGYNGTATHIASRWHAAIQRFYQCAMIELSMLADGH
jgi:hypothetical protein